MKKKLILIIGIVVCIIIILFIIKKNKIQVNDFESNDTTNVNYNENTGVYTIKDTKNNIVETNDEVLVKIYEKDLEYDPKLE